MLSDLHVLTLTAALLESGDRSLSLGGAGLPDERPALDRPHEYVARARDLMLAAACAISPDAPAAACFREDGATIASLTVRPGFHRLKTPAEITAEREAREAAQRRYTALAERLHTAEQQVAAGSTSPDEIVRLAGFTDDDAKFYANFYD